ncbi:MAG: flagellar hook-associated protein FlgK [Alphaproteobacteria bacterium]|nr:flagellar hook-associated protein FlgK [Alphaproteobacteria bacterium]
MLSVLSRAGQAEQAVASGIDGLARNIANANNPDYRRENVSFTSRPTGGIDLVRLQEAAGKILQTDLLNVTSDEGYADLTNQHYDTLSRLVGFDNDSPYVLTRTTEFVEAWRNLQARPESIAAQEEVRTTAVALTEEIQGLAGRLAGFREEINSVITEEISNANNLITRIHTLNTDIAEARNLETSTAEAEAQRNQALRELSAIINIRVVEDNRGRAQVYTSGGQTVVSEGSTSALSYSPGQFGAAEIRLNGTLLASADGLADFLAPGRLRAHYNFVRGTEASSVQPGKDAGVIVKLEQALDAIAETWVDTETDGSFARAYAGLADGSATPDSLVNNAFFTLTEGRPARLGFSLREDIATGTAPIDTTALFADGETNLLAVLESQNRSFAAEQAGLPAYWQQDNRDYEGIVRGIFAQISSGVNQAESQASTESHRLALLNQEIASQNGVNIDEELAQLTVLQNSYAANARVFQIAQELLDELLASVR